MNLITTSPVSIDQLPKVYFDELKDLPPVSAIYYVSWGKSLLYVGCTQNLQNRFKHHHRAREFEAFETAVIRWAEQPKDTKKRELAKLEESEISRLHPLLNDCNGAGFFESVIWLKVSNRHLPELARMSKQMGKSMNEVLSMRFSEMLDGKDGKGAESF